jgi:hypothetical protein
MNAAQRRKHRRKACPECGKQGKHWLQIPDDLLYLTPHAPAGGFWTCGKFYDPITKRRIGT